MINPQSESVEYYNDFIVRIANGGTISEFEYKRTLKLLSKDKSVEAICAIGLAHTLFGRETDAINWFKELTPFTNLFILKSFGVVLRHFGRNKELINLSLGYADHFRDIWFSWMNMDYYYTIGDISNSARKAREFLSMMPDNANKERAEYSISRQLDSLSLVYSSGHCTPEQFRMVSDLVLDVLDENKIHLLNVEVFFWGDDGTSYEARIPLEKGDFKTLRKLNNEVIKRIITKEELDSCEVTPCFTDGGLSNWRYIHVS
ncbi:hypothetical protein NMF47_13210 [Serratia nevei]|uniref:hypothetical protein n=1 Tax=Serratia TaxID=613 RepID=UPI0027E4D081|nr:hypothetical protein [Serratia nevei]MDQ7769458.1 hypothetical protein [Serratia nevei]